MRSCTGLLITHKLKLALGHMRKSIVSLLLFTVFHSCCRGAAPIPIGLDAYRDWDQWPVLRLGMRTYLRSTYDRSGGNEGADASHFLYQLSDDQNVTLDLQGPGLLCFVRYNHWHGSPWLYEVDGVDHLIRETSTADSLHPVEGSVWLPSGAFPPPLAFTWASTKGADLSWVPIPFEKSFRMSYSRTRYGTGYYIYERFVPGTKLSHPIRSWKETQKPDQKLFSIINRSGSNLLPEIGSTAAKKMKLKEIEGTCSVPPGASMEVAMLTNAPASLRALHLSTTRVQSLALDHTWLRITWDGSQQPSINVPVALFFGAGTLYNRNDREYLVKAFPVSIRFDHDQVHLACYFPMPFFHSARIELLNSNETNLNLRWSLQYASLKPGSNPVAPFHATYTDHPHPRPGHDLVLLDTRSVEGGGDWSGHFVGMSWIFSDRAVLNTLEGDPRFFFDDAQTPQGQGTGTEEWGGGGDYWGGENMTLPFAGHPTGARNAQTAKNDLDKVESAYRFLLTDLMPFGKNAVIHLEHGGLNESLEHYQAITYWYGIHQPTLVKTDELKVGNFPSERAHNYISPQASPPYEISSRFEWGVDHLNGQEIYPEEKDYGRKTIGDSEFSLKLDPNSLGVMLRRKLDYQFPNQRAEVFVANARQGQASGRFKSAGIWYLAGSSTCVYSNPKEELGATQHIVQTSNRRFRDDEFLLPRNLTDGRSEIRVRIHFTPVSIPLFPGAPLPELAWSELRYDAYCFVSP
jgi:hypothetical protein